MGTLSQIFDSDQMQKITSEFQRLRDRCYLENVGAALYPRCLIERINTDLLDNVYMNPHTDKYTKDCVEQIRTLVLRHFNTDSTEYSIIFTSGTTQSLKLAVESFQFANDENEVLNCGSFIYLRDNHTSVLGLRELAQEKDADVIHISHEDFLHTLSDVPMTPSSWKDRYKNEGNTLFVYPAQSNFNGFKYPLNCIEKIKGGCLNSYIRKHLGKINCNWYVMLDAASYVSTNKLDLSQYKPDLVCLSFYKMFGYPTGLGALLVKNSSADVLTAKQYFGGGTVDIVLSSEEFYVRRSEFHERFEDGTSNFLSILSLKHCFDTLHSLVPKLVNEDIMDTISHHTFHLAKDLYNQLTNLKHQNGVQAVVLYMDSTFTDVRQQGAIVTFNLLRDDGCYIGYAEFQHMADLFNINVRTGCFCNSGSCQRHLKVTNKEMKDMYKAGHKCGDEIDLIQGRPTGAIRASFAYYNTFNDVDKLVLMICRCFIKTKYVKPKRKQSSTKKIEPKKNFSNLSSVKILDNQDFLNINENHIRTESRITLKSMAIFPIKSCGAFKIKKAWMIGAKGFKFDREWMIVKDNGVCLTQKQCPRMCMIRPKVDLKRNILVLNFKGRHPISVPLDCLDPVTYNVSVCQSKVCTDTVTAYDCGDEASQWVSEALEISYLRLIRQSDTNDRVHKSKKKEGDKTLLSLSNQAQYLLINKATVRWLSSKIRDNTFDNDIDNLADRFRGNLVIDMDEELAEREWQSVIIGKHEFKVDGPCSRCQMVCIDQHTGEKTVEPLRTISEQFAGKMKFGIYLTYIGTVDGSKDCVLMNNSPVKPINTDDNISSCPDWFCMHFLGNYSCQCDNHNKRKVRNKCY